MAEPAHAPSPAPSPSAGALVPAHPAPHGGPGGAAHAGGGGGHHGPVPHVKVPERSGGMEGLSSVFARFVTVLGLLGCLIGILMSSWNQDQLGWSLLRTAGLGVVFAWAGRYLATLLMRAWLETQVETLEKELAAEVAAEAGVVPEATPGAKPGSAPVDRVAAAKQATPAPTPGAKAK